MSTKHKYLALAVCLTGVLTVCRPAKAQLQTTTDDDPIKEGTYAGELPAPAGANAELESRAAFDNNVLDNNADKASDVVFQEGAILNLWKTDPRWVFGLQYRPTLLRYGQHTALNTIDQGLRLNGSYDFTQRLKFQGTESLDDVTGMVEPSSNEYFSLPTSPFPTLNRTVITPQVRELSNTLEGHILYDVSERGSLDLMGGNEVQNFTAVKNSEQGEVGFFDTNGDTGGIAYKYRWSQQVTIGARYLYQYFHFGLGGSDETHEGFLTADWQAGPHVALDLYGGPSYSTTIGASSLSPIVNERSGTLTTLSPAFGGSFTLRSEQTVFELNGGHQVSNGGGLLMTVTNSYGGAEIRHHFGEDWDLLVMAGDAGSDALQGQEGKGSIRSQSFGAGVEHPIISSLSVHVEYDFLRQRVNQFVPLGSNLNMGEFSVSVFYRIGDSRL